MDFRQFPGIVCRYLALGDSYTIGEGVAAHLSFPNQSAQLLRQSGFPIADPVIIARTGWTTGELAAAILEQRLPETFDLVTLLIGVNDQYRGVSAEAYRPKFRELLQMAAGFCSDMAARVYVLSIPDYGVTPFAGKMDKTVITREVDLFNVVNRNETVSFGAQYLDITEDTRLMGADPSLVTADGLHPSAKEYTVWAARLIRQIRLSDPVKNS